MLAQKGNSDAQYGLGKLYASVPLHHSGNFYTSGFGDDFWDACEKIALYEKYEKNNVPKEVTDPLDEFLKVVHMDTDSRHIVNIERGGDMGKESFITDFERNVRTLAVKWLREAARQGHKEAQNALRGMKETW